MKVSIKIFVVFIALFFSVNILAQEAVNYQQPPKEIADLLLAKPTPSVSIDSKGEWMLFLERNTYPTVEELGQPEVRIAGLRLNPNNFSPSRNSFINNIWLKNIKTKKEFKINGLPQNLQAGNFRWNDKETKFAFTHTTATRVDVYVVNIATQLATKINTKPINLVLGNSLQWLDDNSLMYKVVTNAAITAPKKPVTPKGPSVQQNMGKSAPSRTFQDLIKTPYDEQLFEFMATAQIVVNKNGIEANVGKPDVYTMLDASPDKKYLLIQTLKKPYSYSVPAYGFASSVSVVDMAGNIIKDVANLPSTETTPSGNDNVQNVPRSFEWRDDEPATLIWCEPLDSGLIKNKVDYHDAVYSHKAPFKGNEVQELFKTKMRFRNVIWGNDVFAWVNEGLTGKQMIKTSRLIPSTKALETLFERSSNDAYNFMGNPVTTKNNFGRNVVQINGNHILLNNTTGSSPKGDLPFVAVYNFSTKKSEIIWRCQEESFEFVTDVLDPLQWVFITRKESQKQVPDYFIRNVKANTLTAITSFKNPYPALEGISKQKVKYTRADGVELTGDLYLPKGYNKDKDGLLPVLMWAYPREFNSATDAAQVRGSIHKFTTVSWASPIFYVTQGFAVLDNAEMPIVSTANDKKPNDNFIEQLKMNAEAAINYLSDAGIADRNKIAVGGHSYGAFMTANLLAHTNLFKAGIARSGAYNRTLTPFGFQNEDRTYWQAPHLYYEMSPFSYADKIKTPLLLIHGDSDDNQGTFPINSERLFNAIKGHGGTVRYVSLPYEAHSYRGKENLLHLLWEQNEWLKQFVK